MALSKEVGFASFIYAYAYTARACLTKTQILTIMCPGVQVALVENLLERSTLLILNKSRSDNFYCS